MPRIQEYLPETEASGPVGGVSPNLELDTAEGRGLETLGKSIGDVAHVLHTRQAQSEMSDAAATYSGARVDFLKELTSQVNAGTLDVDKFKDQMETWRQKQLENYSTPEAQNYFNRLSNKMSGALVTRAIHGQTVIAANNAKADFDTFLNNSQSAVEMDPTHFKDTMEDVDLHLGHLMEAKGLKAEQVPLLKEHANAQLVQAAVRGYYKSDPDAARGMLESGDVDKYINDNQKKALFKEIDMADRAKDVEDERTIKIAKEQQKALQQTWEQDALPKMLKGGLSTKEILNAPGTAEDKLRWINLVKTQNKEQAKTDPVMKNAFLTRMLLPDNDPKKISDPSQIMDEANKGHIAAKDVPFFMSYLSKTDDGKQLNTSRKQLHDLARSALVKPAMPGLKDPDGEFRYMQFAEQLHEAEADRKAQKLPVKDLYDINSPAFFGKQLNRFRATPQEIIKAMTDRMTGRAVEPKEITTSLGVKPTPDKPQNQGVLKRIPGESAVDYLKRIKGK